MFYTLRVRIAVTFILLLVVPLVTISAVLTKVSNDVIGKSIADSTSQTMDQYAAFVNTLTRQVEDVANQVLSNEVTQKWIAAQLKNELTPEERVVLSAELRKYLSSVALNNSVVSSITVFDHKGHAIGIGDQVIRDASYLQSKWYDEFVNQGIRWAKVHEDPHQPNYLRSKPVNSLLFPMVQLESFRNVGVLKVNFLSAQLEEQINRIQFGTSSRLFILDRSGNPVIRQNGSDPPSMLGSEWETIWTDKRVGGERTLDIDGEEHMLFFRKLPVTDWILIVQIPRKELYQKLESVQRTIVWISGLLLIVTVAAAYGLSSGIAKPLSRLVGAMRHVERGDFDKAEKALPAPFAIKNEVGFASMVFHHMLKRLRYLIETEYQANLRRRDAEFKALLMQINPHFLYNTLEVIGGLAVQGKNAEVVEVTESLGLMLRFSLKLDSELVKFSEELQYIRYYVSIMKVRFHDRIDVRIEAPPEAANMTIIKFMLQPLVENAIKYSLECREVAKVRIFAAVGASRLTVVVEDNGKGMAPDLIDEIVREANPGQAQEKRDVLNTPGKRIGLRNVLTRCRLLYGDGFSVRIRSEPGNGTAIRLEIPALEEAQHVQHRDR